MEDEPEKYHSQFSEYIKKGIDAENLEEMYKKVHAAIRADPIAKKSEKPASKEHKRYSECATAHLYSLRIKFHLYNAFPPLIFRRFNLKKLSYEERKAKLIERLNALNSTEDNDSDEDWVCGSTELSKYFLSCFLFQSL